MRTRVFKDFTFEAAHSLPYLPEGHKCKRVHGHSYQVRVTIEGAVEPSTGMVIDYARITQHWQTLIFDELDHKFINDVPGLEVSTSENLAKWIYDRLITGIEVSSVEVKETATAGAVYGR